MKILNYLNVSNISNLDADSGFIFQKLLMHEILRQRPDWEFFFISPAVDSGFDPRIHHVALDYGHNKFESRFNFPWYELAGSLGDLIQSIDLIYVNQSELASDFKAFSTALAPDRKIPLVSYFHYAPIEPPHLHFGKNILDYDSIETSQQDGKHTSIRFDASLDNNGLALPIFMRQIEAMQVSDLCLTCSDFGVDLLVGNAHKIVPTVAPNITSVPPPVSLEEAAQAVNSPPLGNRIVFNHRLYNHYGPLELLEFMDKFYNEVRQDFEVVITDPTNRGSSERRKLNPQVDSVRQMISSKPYMRIDHQTSRQEYYQMIKSARLSIAPFKPSALWSMSVVDSMICGVPVICPHYACFPEIIGAESQLLFSSQKEMRTLIEKLFDDQEFYEECSAYCFDRAKKFSVEHTAQRYISLFESVTNGRS